MTLFPIRRFALALLLGSIVSATSAWGKPVKLAILLPLSNVNKYSGNQAKQGFEIGVQQEVAELGVDWAAWVKFEYFDTRSDKAHALELAKSAIAQNARAVLGLHSSAVTLHVRDYVLDTAKVPYVVFAGGVSSKIRRKHPLFIRVSNDAKMVMLPLASWLKAHPIVSSAKPRWVCIYTDYTWGRTSCDAFKMGYEDVGEEIGRVPSPLKTVSKKKEIVKLVKFKPDFAVAPFTGAEANVFLRDYFRFHVQKKIPLVMAGSAFTERHLKRYSQTLEQYNTGVGILHGDIYTPKLTNEANRHFVTRYKQLYDMRPTNHAMRAYDAGRLLVKALAKLEGNWDGAKVVQLMKTLPTVSPRSGEILKFDSYGDAISPGYIYITKREGDRLVKDLLGKVPAVNLDNYKK